MPLRAADLMHWGEGQSGNLPLKLLRNDQFGHFLAQALFFLAETHSVVRASHCCAGARAKEKHGQSKRKEGSEVKAPPAAKNPEFSSLDVVKQGKPL